LAHAEHRRSGRLTKPLPSKSAHTVAFTGCVHADGLAGEIESFAREPHGGLMVLPDVSTANNRDLIIALAARPPAARGLSLGKNVVARQPTYVSR
jgi:hypothetical protein